MTANEPRCIYCGKAKEGLPVQEDYLIYTARLFKRHVTHSEKGYELVVCKECFPRYIKAKNNYQARQGRLIAIGVIFALVLIVLGTDKLTAVLDGIVVIIFTYLISLLSYAPSVSVKGGAGKGRMGRGNAPQRHRRHAKKAI